MLLHSKLVASTDECEGLDSEAMLLLAQAAGLDALLNAEPEDAGNKDRLVAFGRAVEKAVLARVAVRPMAADRAVALLSSPLFSSEDLDNVASALNKIQKRISRPGGR